MADNVLLPLDVVIPCYNAEKTLQRAVDSVLNQSAVHRLYLIDDDSQDRTWQLIQQLAARSGRISALQMPLNGGVAQARNWGALQSEAPLIAFLDADDAYQNEALTAAQLALSNFNYLSMVRLPLIAVDLPLRYAQHADLAHAWQILQMTVGGNTVFRRALFLAAGGFPQDPLFRRLGGEDGALGRAFVAATVVGTLFDQWGESGLNGQKCGNDSVQAAGVLHFCRDGMHAERLLDAVLFQRHDPQVLHYLPQAEQVTQRIIRQLQQLSPALQVEKCGVMPLYWQV